MLAMGISGIVDDPTRRVVVFMAIIRDILRTAYLSPYFEAGELATKTQLVDDPTRRDVLILFMLLFVIGKTVKIFKKEFLFLEVTYFFGMLF